MKSGLKSLTLLFSFLILISSVVSQEGGLTADLLDRYNAEIGKIQNLNQIINAVTNNNLKSLSLNREMIVDHNTFFDHKVKLSNIIDQDRTGRCWMFAGVNIFSPRIITKLSLDDFELSEPFLAFYDKLEKSNFFLERVIELRDRPVEDRSLQNEMSFVFGDGGWWHYFYGLIKKYGVVPIDAMPETEQSKSTGTFNSLGETMLRAYGAELRRMHRNGISVDELRTRKEEMLSNIYKLLVFNYGKPPKEFIFRYETKNKDNPDVKDLIENKYTPKSFFEEYFGDYLPEYIALTNIPTRDFDTTFLLEASRNISDDKDFLVLNLSADKLKEYTKKSLLSDHPVWFACDVYRQNYRDSGIFREGIYDYETTLGLDFSISKADRIDYGDISPNHAMVITGVDTSSTGSTIKWQVENSWGTKTGDKGMWTMYDNWFDEYVLLVVVDKSLLSDSDQEKLAKEPVVIPDWEPFFLALRNIK